MGTMESVVLRDAVVLPYRGCVLDYNGGVVLPDELAGFRHTRNWKPCETYYGSSDLVRLDGEFVLLGPLYSHFGHVMTEMIHRILPGKEAFGGASKYIVISTESAKENRPLEQELPQPFFLSILDLFGIDPGDVVVVNRPTVAGTLAIAGQGSDLGGGPRDWYLELLDRHMAERFLPRYSGKDRPTTVYVGRSSLSSGILAGEAYVEGLLAEVGFATVHPERLSFDEQMATYASAREIIFSEGSAVHGLELFGRSHFRKIGVVARRAMRTRRNHYNYFSKILKLRAEEVYFADSLYLGSAWDTRGTNSPDPTYGLALFDLENLFHLLRQFGIDIREKFRMGRFLEACEADLARYGATRHDQSLGDMLDFNPASLARIDAGFREWVAGPGEGTPAAPDARP